MADNRIPPPPEGDTPALGGPGETFLSPFQSEMGMAPPPGDIFADPTLGEKAAEVGTGLVQGVKQGALTLPPAIAGARYGAMAGAPFAPPYGAIAGGIGGFIGGLTLGTITDQRLDDLFPLPKREDLIPYREGGKTTGAVIGGAPAAFGIPEMSANMIARWISGIGSAARRYPVGFLAAESLGGIGAGIGGGTAVAYDPESPWTRFFAETAGGLATSPVTLMVSQAGAAKNFLTDFSKAFSGDARKQKAANTLVAGLTEAGEDPDRIVAFLNSPAARDAIKQANPTVAQLTGSPLLTRLETTLSKNHPDYKAAVDKQGENALTAYKTMVQRLQDIGTPEALTMAANAERDFFMKMTHDRVNLAMKNAGDKISKITSDTPQSRREIGSIVKTATLDALSDAREMEKELWQRAARDAYRITRTGQAIPKSVRPEAITENFLYVLDGMTPERFSKEFSGTLSPIMRRLGYEDKFYERFAAGKQTEQFVRTGQVPREFIQTPRNKTANVEDLIQIRSDLLAYSRKAASAGDTDEARIYGRLAESVLDDLSQLNTQGYNVARQYSKDLNDYFTRSYARELRSTTGYGAEKIPAEVLVSRVYGGGADLTARRMEQIEDSVGFMRREYDRIAADPNIPQRQKTELLARIEPLARMSDQRVASITDAQTRVMRLAAAQSINPATGRLDVNRLARYVNENRDMLSRMGILQDLEDATVAENLFKQVSNVNSKINEKLIKQTAFSSVLDAGERPTLAITNALNSKKPLTSFNKIVNMARRADVKDGTTNAVDGLKSSVYDYAFTKAGGAKNFSPQAFEDALFKPIAPNQPSIMAILRSQGMITLTEQKNMQRLINPMKKVEAGLQRGEQVDNLVSGADAVTDLALRIIGARIGTSVAPGGPGALIAASAGSKAVRTIFDRYPTMSITKIIEDATRDPVLMRELLTKGRTVDERIQLGRRLNNYLFTAGYNAATFDPQELGLELPQTPTTGPSAAQMLRQLPPAPPTKGVPGLQLQQPKGQGAGAAAPAAPGGAQSQSRSMFQSLFPMDTISPLLNQPR